MSIWNTIRRRLFSEKEQSSAKESSSSKSIDISLQNEVERFVGLTAFTLILDESLKTTDTIAISVLNTHLVAIKKTGNEPKTELLFHIHNHLLPEGKAEICFSLQDSSGTEQFSFIQTIPIVKEDRLSHEVQTLLTKHEVEWGSLAPVMQVDIPI